MIITFLGIPTARKLKKTELKSYTNNLYEQMICDFVKNIIGKKIF